MRVTTLKATAGGVGGLLSYYAGLAERPAPGSPGRGPADYYLDPDEPPGRWWGDGQPGLGVAGEVEGRDLRAVLEGRHPTSEKPLGLPFTDRSARGFDATFSAPKSVSVLWALSPDRWVRAEVLAAHDRAVEIALGWFQDHGAVTRRGKAGVRQVDTLGVAAAVFRQHTSRTIDPQLHSHAVIMAKVQDPTGKWLSLDARFLTFQQRTIGWIYDAALRAELTARLGVAWGPLEGGQAELVAVPAEVRDLFSQRTRDVNAKRDELIARWSADHDGADPDHRTIARLERTAVLTSRPAKTHGLAAHELHDLWAGQGRDIGFDLERLTHERLRGPDRARPGPDLATDAIGAEALRRVSEEASSWLPADLARHVATLLPAERFDSAEQLVAMVDRITDGTVERCIGLGPERDPDRDLRRDRRPVLEHVTDRRLSTADVLAQEQRLQHWALSHAYPIEPGTGTGDLQADAVAAMAGPPQLVVVVGPAGSGKTRTVAAAVADLQQRHRPVIGLAPSGKAADVLRVEAGCPTDTLAGFLTRHRNPGPSPWPVGTTIIVDEAGMAATQDLAELVQHARTRHWRIIAVGDPAQLPSVGRGGVFAHWCNTVPHHTLDTPRRFHDPWEADASLALRRGDPDIAPVYAAHHRLHATHPALLPQQLAATYRNHVDAGRTVAITTVCAATARDINRAIQDLNYHRSDERRLELADGTVAYIGDQVATRRNDRTLTTNRGEPVRNRHTWTISDIDPSGRATVAHPERGTTLLPVDYTRQHVELGWAVTGYGNQGDTVDIGLAVLEPGATRQHTYVALTRGREQNHAHIPDPIGTLEPADHLASILTQTLDRESALATTERLHRDIGRTPPALDDLLGIDRSFGRER